MSKQFTKLEKWSVVGYGLDPYKAPEQAVVILVGVVTGHPEFQDGTEICTSPLKMISVKNKLAITTNTTYELGEPSVDFIEWLDQNHISVDQYEIGRLDS